MEPSVLLKNSELRTCNGRPECESFVASQSGSTFGCFRRVSKTPLARSAFGLLNAPPIVNFYKIPRCAMDHSQAAPFETPLGFLRPNSSARLISKYAHTEVMSICHDYSNMLSITVSASTRKTWRRRATELKGTWQCPRSVYNALGERVRARASRTKFSGKDSQTCRAITVSVAEHRNGTPARLHSRLSSDSPEN